MNQKRRTTKKTPIPSTKQRLNKAQDRDTEASGSRLLAVSLVGGVVLVVSLFVLYNTGSPESSPTLRDHVNTLTAPLSTSEVQNQIDTQSTLHDVLSENSTQPEQSIQEQSLTAQFYEHIGLQPDDSSLQMDYFEHEDTLELFAEQYLSELSLPEITEDDITITEETGTDAVSSYITSISEENENLHVIDISDINQAVSSLLAANNGAPLDELVEKLNHNVEVLKTLPVPEEAVSLHIAYSTATIALTEHVKNIRTFQGDPVRAYIAASAIAELETVFEEIETALHELLKDLPQYPV